MDDIDLEERIELVPSSTSKTRREHGEESKEGRWAERKRSFEANLHSFPRWEGDEGLTMDEVQRFRTRGPVSRSFRVAEGAGAPPPRERRAFVFRFVSTREPRAGTASSEKRRPRASRCPSSAGFSSCRSSPFGANYSSSPRPCRRRLRRPRRTRGAPSSTESGGTGPVGTSAAPRRAHAWRLSRPEAVRRLTSRGSARRVAGPPPGQGPATTSSTPSTGGWYLLISCLTAVRAGGSAARSKRGELM